MFDKIDKEDVFIYIDNLNIESLRFLAKALQQDIRNNWSEFVEERERVLEKVIKTIKTKQEATEDDIKRCNKVLERIEICKIQRKNDSFDGRAYRYIGYWDYVFKLEELKKVDFIAFEIYCDIGLSQNWVFYDLIQELENEKSLEE